MSTIPSLFTCLSFIEGYKILDAGAKSCHILNLDISGYRGSIQFWFADCVIVPKWPAKPLFMADKYIGRCGCVMT